MHYDYLAPKEEKPHGKSDAADCVTKGIHMYLAMYIFH